MRLISLTFKYIICVWSVYICVCSNIYGHICVGTCASMCCLWNPQINLRGCPSADIHLLLRQGLSLRTWRSLIKLGWLASSLGDPPVSNLATKLFMWEIGRNVRFLYKASTLPAEPSLSPSCSLIVFISNICSVQKCHTDHYLWGFYNNCFNLITTV